MIAGACRPGPGGEAGPGGQDHRAAHRGAGLHQEPAPTRERCREHDGETACHLISVAGGDPAGGEQAERYGKQREQGGEIAGHGGQGPEPGLRGEVGEQRVVGQEDGQRRRL